MISYGWIKIADSKLSINETYIADLFTQYDGQKRINADSWKFSRIKLSIKAWFAIENWKAFYTYQMKELLEQNIILL